MSAFFDTNILIYRLDSRDARKQRIAGQLIDAALAQNACLISTQSLQEFYTVATRKLGLAPAEARLAAAHYRQARIVRIMPELVFAAMDRHAAGGMSYWDALIIEAALAGGAATLYTEDLQDGARFGSLVVRNPFLGL